MARPNVTPPQNLRTSRSAVLSCFLAILCKDKPFPPMSCTSVSSAIVHLNAAIAAANPFERATRVTEREIWWATPPNLEGLNPEAIAAVLDAVERARKRIEPLSSLAILGETGTGKTHAIACVRQQLQRDRRGLLVYVNAGQFSDVNLIRYQFLQTVVDSFRHPGSANFMQWQDLATAIALEAFQSIYPERDRFSVDSLVNKLNRQTLSKNQTWIAQLSEAFFKIRPTLGDPDLVRALLWTLCHAQAPYAIKWLAGQVLASAKAEELGLPNRSRDYRDAQGWEIVLEIFSLATQFYPVVIAFDQLDSPENSDTGLKRERVVASLVKRIWETLPIARLNYGVVLAIAATPQTWYEKIQSLPSGIVAYLSKSVAPIRLQAIDVRGMRELVGLFLQQFYDRCHLIPPRSLYPFDSDQLDALAREELNVRELLEWCAENFRPVEVDPWEAVQIALDRAKQTVEERQLHADRRSLVAALQLALQMLLDRSIAGVTLEAVESMEARDLHDRRYVPLRAIVRTDAGSHAIGLAIVPRLNASELRATFARLLDRDRLGLDGACLLAPQIPAHWQCRQGLARFIRGDRCSYIPLDRDALTPLLALWWLHRERQQWQLGDREIVEFVRQHQFLAENPTISAILSTAIAPLPQAVEGDGDRPYFPPDRRSNPTGNDRNLLKIDESNDSP
jgi:Cdc6-like AAA superfamily ATPase